MKNSFYSHWTENHNLPTMDEKIIAAGVAPEHVSIFSLENELAALVGETRARQIETGIFATCPTREQQIAALQAAIREAEAVENAIEAMKSEDVVTETEGFTGEQEQQAHEQAIVAHKIRRSRQPGFAGTQWPVYDPADNGLYPGAYTCKRGKELEEAAAFFA